MRSGDSRVLGKLRQAARGGGGGGGGDGIGTLSARAGIPVCDANTVTAEFVNKIEIQTCPKRCFLRGLKRYVLLKLQNI